MTDPFKHRALGLSGPSRDLAPVTPDDSHDLPEVALALYIETAGTVSFISVSGAMRSVKMTNYAILPVGVRRVLATGTTASGLHAFTVQ